MAKSRNGNVEAIRTLRIARSSARGDRRRAINQLRSLVATAPDGLREQLRELTNRQLVNTAAAFRPSGDITVTMAAKLAMRESPGASSTSRTSSGASTRSSDRS